MSRRRLDVELVARGLFSSHQAARAAIEDRVVTVDGAPALKPETLVLRSSTIHINEAKRFVSRGGIKLEGALEDLSLDVRDLRCLDAGAGTGGFTDCLIQRGASEVVAVDVGYGQIDWKLRSDPRIKVLERTNVRLGLPADVGSFDLAVADLSFISLKSVLAVLAARSDRLLLLLKPQFEAAKDEVPPGGVIQDEEVWDRVILEVSDFARTLGLELSRKVPSRLKGQEGNQEFFLLFEKSKRFE